MRKRFGCQNEADVYRMHRRIHLLDAKSRIRHKCFEDYLKVRADLAEHESSCYNKHISHLHICTYTSGCVRSKWTCLGVSTALYFLACIFPFDRGTIWHSPEVVPLTGRMGACGLEDDVVLKNHLRSKGRQMAFGEIVCVSRLEIAMIYTTYMQAWLRGFSPVATISTVVH